MFRCAPDPKRGMRGFSLFEMLLTVGIITSFLLFVIQIGQTIAREQATAAAANYVKRIDEAVSAILANPDRFNQVHANVLASPNFIAQLSIDDLRNSNGVLAGIPAANLLNDNFPDVAPYNQTYRVIFRVGDNPADATDVNALDVFIVSETLISDTLATTISAKIGGGGGALRDTADISTGSLRASFGAWSVPTNNLLNTAWYNAVTANPNQPTVDNGAYVAFLHRFDLNRVARDYLYRNDMGDAELNTMHADLSLGGFNLMGVDDITATGRLTGTEVAVKSTAQLQSNSTISGTLQSDNRATTSGSVAPSGATTSITVVGGTMAVIDNGANRGTTTITGAQVENTVTTRNLVGQQIVGNQATLNGNLTVTAPAGLNATAAPAGLGVIGPTVVTGVTRAADYNATGDINVTGGRVGMVNMQTNGLAVSGSTTGNGGNLERISVGGTARVNSLGDCDEGC